MTAPAFCLECGAPLTPADAGGLCPKCLLKLGFATQLASGTLPAIAVGLTPDGTFSEPFDFGGYRILRLLGKGGMGAAYEAEQLSSGRRVALKVLGQTLGSPENRQRFVREGQLAAAIRHPNVVAVFSAEEIEGAPVIAMELVPDGTLRDEAKRRGPLPITEAVDATLQIIDGLEAAHDGGVLHRDIKPTNCFLAPGGRVKVGDFGLSISTLVKAEAQLTQPGAVLGTPAFASPEQLRAGEIDVRSDIYSVGATLYSLLTGKPPHDAETLVALIAAALEKSPAEPHQLRPEIPQELSRLIMRCLAKDPTGRFRDYAELRTALLPFSSAVPVPAPLGSRFLAGVIDSFVIGLPAIIAFCVLGMDLETSFLSERSARTALLLAATIVWEIACIGLPEGIWGAGLGKALCGLRVLRPNGARPGIPRALVRSLLFSLVPRLGLVTVWFTRTAAEYRWHATIAGDPMPEDWLWIIIFALFVTMRRRNGYAAVQDLITGTRVVVQAARPARPRLPVPTAQACTSTGEKIGPFGVIIRGEDLALAYDEVLRRHVWIRLLPGETATITTQRRDLNRPTRLRWLTGRRSPGENWDAFEAPEGMPLTAFLDGQQSWKRVRGWLLDLAEELRGGLDDHSLPEVIGADRVWLTADGHAVLLDFRAPGSATAAAKPITSQAEALRFLDEIATAAVGRRVPLHAQEILRALREQRFESVALAAGNLHAAMPKTTEISSRRRLLSLTVAPAVALVMALMFSYLIKSDVQLFETMWGQEDFRTTSRTQHFEVMFRESDDPIALLTPTLIVIYRAKKNRDMAEGKKKSYWEEAEASLVGRENVTTEQLRDAELRLEPYFRAVQDYENKIRLWMFPVFFFSLLALGALIGIATGMLSGTPLGLRLNDLAIVTAQGVPASRGRVLLRSVLGWSPVIFVVCALYALEFSTAIFWAIVGVPLLVLLAGLVVMVRWPERAPQDYVTRTWLVPR